MVQMSVAAAIAKIMREYGANHLFTFTGAPQDVLIHAHNHEGVRVVLARSERSALAMADAYARLTAKPTFGIVQYGPGAAYLPACLSEAYWACSPLIAIGGTINTQTRHRLEYQEFDQTPLFPPITRWSGDLPAPDRIIDVLRTAIRAAVSGNPGPAYLGVPSDWFALPLSNGIDLYAEPDCLTAPAFRTAPTPGSAERVLTALTTAERPLIFAGGGVVLSSAWSELTELADALGIPVVTTLAGKGAISGRHPLAVGTAGRYSRRVANEALSNCDLCVAIGTKLGSMGTNVFACPRQGTRIIHIDVDPLILGRTYREEISIVADAKLALAAVCNLVPIGLKDRWADWTRQVQSAVASWYEHAADEAKNKTIDGRINPYHVMAILNEFLNDDDIIVADTGYMAVWSSVLLDRRAPGRNTLRAAGSLGWAFPAAFGAKLAVGQRRRVVGLTGDGGIGYHLADLETANRINTPAIQLVMNNCSLAFEYHVQRHIHGELCAAASEFVDVDYAAVARAFDCYGERVFDPDEIMPALRRAENSGKPAVVDLVVSREAIPPVTRYEAAGLREL